MKIPQIFLVIIATALFSKATAQNTWDSIYTILNTNCGSTIGGCHEAGSSNPSFNVDAAPSVLYTQLINGDPMNPWAKDSVGNKLVVPYSAELSFLMRKLSHCSTGPLALYQPFEGASQPDGGNRLPDADLEMISIRSPN